MIERSMYFILGFLSMGIVGLCLLPALWQRAVRLTRKKLELQFPFSMSEIVAERDALRAEAAAQLRVMEMDVEKFREILIEERIKAGQQTVQIHKINAQLQAITQERDMLTQQGVENRQRLQNAETDCVAMNLEIQQAHGARQDWSMRYSLIQNQHMIVLTENEEHRQINAQLERRLAVLQSARNQETESFKAEINQLRAEIEILRRQLKDAQTQALALPEDYANLRALIVETGTQISLLIGSEPSQKKSVA